METASLRARARRTADVLAELAKTDIKIRYGRGRIRILKWILDRCEGQVGARETPIGFTPGESDLDLTGLAPNEADPAAALKIDMGEWATELESQKEWFDKLGRTLPPELEAQRQKLLQAVKGAQK